VDWLENAGFLWVIFAYPAEFPRIASLAGTLKGMKPIIEAVIVILTLIFSVVAFRISRSTAAKHTQR
jgi:hypothetical protein